MGVATGIMVNFFHKTRRYRPCSEMDHSHFWDARQEQTGTTVVNAFARK